MDAIMVEGYDGKVVEKILYDDLVDSAMAIHFTDGSVLVLNSSFRAYTDNEETVLEYGNEHFLYSSTRKRLEL